MLDRRNLLAALTLGWAGAFAAITPALAQGVKWDMSTVWPDGNFHTQNAKRFAEEVKKATNGAVDITVKGGGQLGFKGPEHLRAVRDGLVPMADILITQQVGDAPLMGIEGTPFLISSIADHAALHKHLRPELDKVAAQFNQKILYIVPWPTQYLHIKSKVDGIDGFKGLKIRVPDKGPADMLATLGMTGVIIPWGETVPALASGAVQGVTTSAVSGVDGKFWEFLKVAYRTNHGAASQVVTVNLDQWKKLTPEQQKAMTDTANRLQPEFWKVSEKADDEAVARLKQGGMEVLDVPPAMMAEFRKRTAHLVDEYLKRVPALEKPVKAYLAERGR